MEDCNKREIHVGDKVRHLSPASQCVYAFPKGHPEEHRNGSVMPGTMSVGFEGTARVTGFASSTCCWVNGAGIRGLIPCHVGSFLEVVDEPA